MKVVMKRFSVSFSTNVSEKTNGPLYVRIKTISSFPVKALPTDPWWMSGLYNSMNCNMICRHEMYVKLNITVK